MGARRRLVAAVAAAGLLCGLGLGLARPASYRATCVIMIPGRPVAEDSAAIAAGPRSFAGFFYYLRTQIELIRSRAVALAAVEKLPPKSRLMLGDDPAAAVMAGLSVERPVETLLVRIHCVSPDPGLSVEVANAVAAAFAEGGLCRWRLSAESASESLAAQMKALDARILEGARSLSSGEPSDAPADASGAEGRGNALRAEFFRARSERIALGSEAEMASRATDARSLLAVPAVASDAEVALERKALAELDLRSAVASAEDRPGDAERLSAEAVAARARLDAAAAAAAERLKARCEVAVARERELERMLAAEEEKLASADARREPLRALGADVEALREERRSLAAELGRLELSARSGVSGIQLVEPAASAERTGRGWAVRAAAAGLTAGLAAAVALAMLLGLLDERVRSPEEIEELLPEGLLGVMPRIRAPAGRWEADLAAHLRPNSPEAEAAKAVRVQLSSMLEAGRPSECESGRLRQPGAQMSEQVPTCATGSPGRSRRKNPVVAVASAAPREGKSTVASALAIVLAQSGRRTVLVDADMRRGELARSYDVEESPGLSEYLSGRCGLHMIQRETAVGGLVLIPSGARPENPAELVESPAFAELIERLRARYDCAVVDVPAVLAVSEGLAASARCDGVIVVARCDSTLRKPLGRALELLRRSGARILGAVVNDVAASNRSYYDYGGRRRADAAGA